MTFGWLATLYYTKVRYFAGFLITLGVIGLVLGLTGGLEVDLQVHFGPHASPAPQPLVLQAKDNGKTVTVKVGQEVVVNLGESYGAAYSSNPKVLAPEATPGASEGMPGATSGLPAVPRASRTARAAGCAGSMANPSSALPPAMAWPATR